VRVGVLGGSFDPIHNAHLVVAQLAREQLGLDRVHLMVAAQQPLKTHHGFEAADRLAMVERAVAGVPGLVADGRELRRSGPSYTIDTLRELQQESPEAGLVLILGADALAGFDRWREPDAIRALARLAVCRRGGEAVPPGADLEVDVPRLDISSTAIRQRLQAGQGVRGWVPDAVADYLSGLRLSRSDAG
jgi:nicotinate-nucleotide adenylyltransferase